MTITDFIVWQVFNKKSRIHNIVMSYIDGKYLSEWTDMLLASRNGYLYVIEYLKDKGYVYNSMIADIAADNNHLHIIKFLESKGIYCTYRGANWAIECGNMEIVYYLESNGIICCYDDNNWLPINKFKYTRNYLDNRYKLYRNPLLSIVKKYVYLDLFNINPSLFNKSLGANLAVCANNLESLKYLEKKNIYCTEFGVILAIDYGCLEVLKYISEYINFENIDKYCADIAAENGNLEIIKFLETKNLYCTDYGADLAAKYNYVDILEYLYNKGIKPTRWGINLAIKNNNIAVMNYIII
jgi:hypothetical protein